MKLKTVFSISLGLILLILVWSRVSFVFFILTGILAFITIPLIFVFEFRRTDNGFLKLVKMISAYSVIYIFIFFPVNIYRQKLKKEFAISLVNQIENYQKVHQSYPKSLNHLKQSKTIQSKIISFLFNNKDFEYVIHTDPLNQKKYFTLTYDEFFSSSIYDGKEKKWYYHD